MFVCWAPQRVPGARAEEPTHPLLRGSAGLLSGEAPLVRQSPVSRHPRVTTHRVCLGPNLPFLKGVSQVWVRVHLLTSSHPMTFAPTLFPDEVMF